MAPRARIVKRAVSQEIRDGVLQDMVAMGMITSALRARFAAEDADEHLRLLDTLSATLSEGAERLRLVINDLEQDVA